MKRFSVQYNLFQGDREIAANTVNWDPTLKNLSDSDSESEEISKKSDLVSPKPEKKCKKSGTLFKKKVFSRIISQCPRYLFS